MLKTPLRVLMLSVFAALALFVAACGGDDDNNSGGSSGQQAEVTENDLSEGKQGGDITFLAAGDVDYIDPGQTYYTFGYMVHYATQRTLYAFEPDDSINPVPDLAEGEPEISEDNKTITVKIKKGVKFSPPVNREVTSKDIKYAFERAFTKQVPSGYASTYFGDIVGVPEEPNAGDYKPISGIETPDDQTLVIKLETPTAVTVASALVMPITTPVPQEYAEKFDAKNPSEYDQNVVFTGPYMVKNNASGKLVGRQPGKRIELVRNPNWDKASDFRPAYLDSVTIDQGNDDLTVASRRTLDGQKLMCCDAGSPPAPVLKRALSQNKDQVAFIPSGGTRWIALNSTIKPLDNLNVRRAILAAFDKEALRLTRGGALLGDIATGYIPPGIPGYEESGGTKQGASYDFNSKPEGDLELAKQYMLKAKEEGVPVSADGLYAGDERLLTIATNADPGKKTAQVAQDQFSKLGFKLNFRQVPQDTLYTKFCGVPSAKVAICPNVGWFKDFVDPQSMLQATFSGDSILKQGNVNWSQLDVPEINQAMKDAALVPAGKERNEAWAKINDQIIAQAPGIPYIWDKTAVIASKDVKQVTNGYYTTQDLTYSSLK